MWFVLACGAAVWLVLSAVMQAAAVRAAGLAAREAPACFRAPPRLPDPDKPLRLAFLGDLQKGVTDVVGPLGRALIAHDAHLLVSSGDFVSHGEGPYYGLVLDAFAIAGIQTPVRVVPGNHDLFPRRSKDDSLGGPHFERHFGSRSWALDLGRIQLVGFDTGGDWLIEEQLANARPVVANDARPWIAVTHRPPFQFDDPDTPPYRDLLPLATFLETHKPALVVAGHLHRYQDREVGGVRYIVNAHGGDVAGDTLRRSDFELVFVDVAPDGTITTRVERFARKTSWRTLTNKLCVRMWADRRKPMGRVLAAPAAVLWKLCGAYVPVVRHPVQRRYPSREEVEARKHAAAREEPARQ